MTHDGMPRAYLRIDPNIDQTHPDINGFVRLMCAAARQPERGRFRSMGQVQAIFGKHRAGQFLTREDLVTLPDGRLYVEGWDEWQEGDHTVADRMKRMRARRAEKRSKTVSPVTVPASPPRTVVTTDAGIERTLSDSLSGDGVGVEDFPSPTGVGLRKDGTNPRALGTNPRANGSSPRQERAAAKRGGIPSSVASILQRAAAAGHEDPA